MNSSILKGSEKQVAWAKKIRDQVLPGIELLRAEIHKYVNGMESIGAEGRSLLIAFYDDGLSKIQANESAVFWIENRWMVRWAGIVPGTPAARADAFTFISNHNDQNAETHREILRRAKYAQDVEQAKISAAGTINSWDEWQAASASFSLRFGSGSRFESLDLVRWELNDSELAEYTALCVESEAASFAMQDFVSRSGGCERLLVGGDAQ